MGVARDKLSTSYWWCSNTIHNNITQNPSTWLQSTLTELDEKTEAILKIIEEDADTFSQRAEMYFKKRPQLINMIEEIYRSHRLLADGYDQIKCASRTHILAPWTSPLPLAKYSEEKFISSMEKSYDSYSESFDPESDSCEDHDNDQDQVQVDKAKTEASSRQNVAFLKMDKVVKLNEEIELLKEERRVQQELLMQKDKEKREAIRQLCIALDLQREENSMLRMSVNKASPKKKGLFKRLFSKSPKY